MFPKVLLHLTLPISSKNLYLCYSIPPHSKIYHAVFSLFFLSPSSLSPFPYSFFLLSPLLSSSLRYFYPLCYLSLNYSFPSSLSVSLLFSFYIFSFSFSSFISSSHSLSHLFSHPLSHLFSYTTYLLSVFSHFLFSRPFLFFHNSFSISLNCSLFKCLLSLIYIFSVLLNFLFSSMIFHLHSSDLNFTITIFCFSSLSVLILLISSIFISTLIFFTILLISSIIFFFCRIP